MPAKSLQGFTLIEVLVVIVIISMTLTIALFAFGDFGASRKVTICAEQFASYIKLVQQRSILEINTFGIKVNEQGFKTYRFAQQLKWKSMPKQSLFKWHAFPDNLRIQVSVSPHSSYQPDIIITPSGDMTPFKITLGTIKNPQLIILNGQQNGNILIQKLHNEK